VAALTFAAILAFGFTEALASGMRDSSPQAVCPRDVIRADGRYGLILGLTAGVILGLAFGVVFGFAFGFTVGLTYGLAYRLASGSSARTRYNISVLIAASRRSGPIRLGAFMEWAHQAGLMRVSGIAYQFRHRELQEWLASHPQPLDPASLNQAGGLTRQAETTDDVEESPGGAPVGG
jgi:hypothetical protein